MLMILCRLHYLGVAEYPPIASAIFNDGVFGAQLIGVSTKVATGGGEIIRHMVGHGCSCYLELRANCIKRYERYGYITRRPSGSRCGAQQLPANFTDRAHGVKAFRTHPGTVADTAAAKQTERVLQSVEPFGAGLIAAVQNEAQRL